MPKLHLYLHTPVPVFKARINMASVTYPVGALVYDNVTLGTESDVSFGATLLLGTTEGADDLGRVRVLDVPVSNTIQISHAAQGVEDGLITVQNDAYITVLDDYRPWAKLPTFDTEDAQDTKDGRITVGNKLTTEIPPVANGGPGFADYINPDTGLIVVQFPRDGVNLSFTVGDGDTITAHDWDVKDGTITVGAASDPVITATFPAGFRYVVYTATSSNGVTHTCRVPVLAVDPDDDTTVGVFSAKQRLEMFGQSLEITLAEDAPRSVYPDGTLAMFWWDAPDSPGSRDHMKFIGWIDNESSSVGRNRKGLTRETSITCLDIAGKLRTLPGFPQAISRVEDESPWSYYPSLDMNKSLHYLLHWHSTVLDIADFILPADGLDYDAMRLDAGGASLFDQVDSQAQKMVPDHYLTCNAAGQLEVKRDWRLDDPGDRPTAGPILTEDAWTDLTYSYNRHPKVHVLRSAAILASTDFVEVDGIDTLPLVFSIAPGDAGAFGQGVREQTENEGLALSQEALNKAEGHRYAMLNHRYGEFSFTDPTGTDFWDYEPAAMRRVQMNIAAQYAAQRGLDFTSAAGLVKSVDIAYNLSIKGVSVAPKITWEKETSGSPALTYVPDSTQNVGYTVPLPTAPDYGLRSGQEMVAAVSIHHIYRTFDFQTESSSGGPTWTEHLDFSVDANDEADHIYSWVVDPFSPGYIVGSGEINGFVATRSHIYRVTDLFGEIDAEVIHTFDVRVGGNERHWRTIQASFGRFFEDDADNPWLMCVSYYYNQSGHTGTWVTYSIDGGATWSEESPISTGYSTTFASPVGSGNPVGLYLSPKTPGLAITSVYDSVTSFPNVSARVSTDWGANWATLITPNIEFSGDPQLPSYMIHVPWPDNNDEHVVYYGRTVYGNSSIPTFARYRLMRVEEDGVSVTDISPSDGTRFYGPVGTPFGVRTHDNDRNYVILGGVGNDITNFRVDEHCGVWVSDDRGNNWQNIVTPTTGGFSGGITGRYVAYQAAFGGDSPNIIFVWGANEENRSVILYSSDLGANLDDRKGNMHSSFDSGTYGLSRFLGIAGGPTS